jgi:transposase
VRSGALPVRLKKKSCPRDEPDDHALGRSRGGWGTKIHALCDAAGNGLALKLSGGQEADISHAEDLLGRVRLPRPKGRPRTRPRRLNADKGYDSAAYRKYLSKRGIRANIPERRLPEGTKRRRKGQRPKLDKERYKNRSQVERFLGKLKQFRRIATRYDKYAMAYLGFVTLGMVLIGMKAYFSNTA